MFNIEDTTIKLTRGDAASIEIAMTDNGGDTATFHTGDIVRFSVIQRKNHSNILLSKDIVVETESETVTFTFTSEETRLGGVINKPIDYWYEVQVNPDSFTQTIIGYDDNGPKIFRLYPEGDDSNG